jgi:hypothetical protein
VRRRVVPTKDWLAGQLSAMGLTPSQALNQPPSALASTDRPRRHRVGQKSGYVVRQLIPATRGGVRLVAIARRSFDVFDLDRGIDRKTIAKYLAPGPCAHVRIDYTY